MLDQVLCKECKAMFTFYYKIQYLLQQQNCPITTVKVIEERTRKAKLYLAHQIRVINQQLAIQKIMKDMHNKCLENKGSNEALVIIDFKMKLEPIYFQETTTEHYGKQGISWHGAMIKFFTYDFDDINEEYVTTDNKFYFD